MSDDALYLTTLPLPESTLDRFRQISDRLQVVQCICDDVSAVPAHLWEQVTILHTNTVLPAPEQTPRLRLVQLDTSGVDHIAGSRLWTETAIPVATIRGVSARWLAEYVVLMILAFSHGFPEMLSRQQARSWPSLDERWRLFGPKPLFGARVVIVGYGRIGRAIGELCAMLGMDVVGVRRTVTADESQDQPGSEDSSTFPRGSIRVLPLAHLGDELPGARYIVVVLPLTRHTRGLIDQAMVEAMDASAVLINVARGGIVDEEAVVAALRTGRLAGAAFDVFGQEPLPSDSPLWSVPNLVISPHVSGFAGDYLAQIETLVGENIRRLLAGEPLVNLADREAGY